MAIATINPTTGELLQTFTPHSPAEVEQKLALAQQTFQEYRKSPFSQRSQCLRNVAQILKDNAREFAELMTLEMGKPIKQAIAEVNKSALGCQFYAENAESYLRDEIVATDAQKSFIRYQPLGIILAVMPWNFPFWQVFRFAAPALMAGNVAVLKHASNVPQCALKLEEIFRAAGFPEGAFQTLLISGPEASALMADDRIKGAALTGSEQAGSSLASAAGKQIKRTVLELGGSDPFIVLESADLEAAADVAVFARMQNNGQSCIAAKRFIVVDSVADRFFDLLTNKLSALQVGDPRDEQTDIGPLATETILHDLEKQVEQTVQAGAKVHLGGKALDKAGYFYQRYSPHSPHLSRGIFWPCCPGFSSQKSG